MLRPPILPSLEKWKILIITILKLYFLHPSGITLAWNICFSTFFSLARFYLHTSHKMRGCIPCAPTPGAHRDSQTYLQHVSKIKHFLMNHLIQNHNEFTLSGLSSHKTKLSKQNNERSQSQKKKPHW